jgi:hypothetical protein
MKFSEGSPRYLLFCLKQEPILEKKILRMSLSKIKRPLMTFSNFIHFESSQVKSSQVKSSQVKSSQVKSSQVKSSQVKSSQVKVYFNSYYHFITEHFIPLCILFQRLLNYDNFFSIFTASLKSQPRHLPPPSEKISRYVPLIEKI